MKDYEKKYKEALERAKKYKLKEDLIITQDIFPELKESDDERIRKALISFLKSPFVNEYITDEKVNPWIAWLEKQGEQKPAWSKEDEAKLKSILFHIEDVENKDVIDWLKSLKDRVQPKQEWSKDDEVYAENVRLAIEKQYPIAAKDIVDWLKSLKPQKKEALPQWRRLPLSGISYAPDYWCVMDVITSTVGANSASVPALVKGDYYVPLFELEKFIRNI